MCAEGSRRRPLGPECKDRKEHAQAGRGPTEVSAEVRQPVHLAAAGDSGRLLQPGIKQLGGLAGVSKSLCGHADASADWMHGWFAGQPLCCCQHACLSSCGERILALLPSNMSVTEACRCRLAAIPRVRCANSACLPPCGGQGHSPAGLPLKDIAGRTSTTVWAPETMCNAWTWKS